MRRVNNAVYVAVITFCSRFVPFRELKRDVSEYVYFYTYSILTGSLQHGRRKEDGCW